MKIKITSPKCNSDNVKITFEEGNSAPMYKCNKCGHKNRVFPKFESDKN